MAEKKTFDNTNRVSMWNAVTSTGKDYLRGTVNVEGIEYNISLFPNDYKNTEKHPDMTGNIKLKEDR